MLFCFVTLALGKLFRPKVSCETDLNSVVLVTAKHVAKRMVLLIACSQYLLHVVHEFEIVTICILEKLMLPFIMRIL